MGLVFAFAMVLRSVLKGSPSPENQEWLGHLSAILALGAFTVGLALLPGRSWRFVLGTDKRLSTSKLQALGWTYAIAGALLSLIVARWAGRQAGYEELLSDGLQDEYLLLLGGPFAAAVAAKALVSSKVATGEVAKTEGAEEASLAERASEAVSDDDGNTDLVDTQYLLFNLIALLFFLGGFFADPDDGLPEIPELLVGLTGLAALTYVSNKALLSETPVLTSVFPATAPRGQSVALAGKYLLTKDAEGPDGFASIGVAFGSVAAHIERREQTDGGDGRLIVRVPQDAIQAAKIQVISNRGVASNALDFEPVAPILTVDPPNAAPGDELIVRTQGIRIPTTDESEPKARVGAYAAEHLERQPGGEDELLLKLSLPKQMPLGATELVVLTAAGVEVGRTKLEVTSGVEIESVSPPRIILGQNEPIQVFGRGFIADGGRATQHNRIELDRRQLQFAWGPTLAVVRLPGSDPAALAAQGFVENRQAEIVVFNDRGQASPPYQVTLEAP